MTRSPLSLPFSNLSNKLCEQESIQRKLTRSQQACTQWGMTMTLSPHLSDSPILLPFFPLKTFMFIFYTILGRMLLINHNAFHDRITEEAHIFHCTIYHKFHICYCFLEAVSNKIQTASYFYAAKVCTEAT